MLNVIIYELSMFLFNCYSLIDKKILTKIKYLKSNNYKILINFKYLFHTFIKSNLKNYYITFLMNRYIMKLNNVIISIIFLKTLSLLIRIYCILINLFIFKFAYQNIRVYYRRIFLCIDN